MIDDVPLVATFHSAEDCSGVDAAIRKHVCVDNTIAKQLTSRCGVRAKSIDVVESPIDFARFAPVPRWGERKRKMVVFVGAVDSMNRASLLYPRRPFGL